MTGIIAGPLKISQIAKWQLTAIKEELANLAEAKSEPRRASPDNGNSQHRQGPFQTAKDLEMEIKQCELYRPPVGNGDKPSCEAAEILTELYLILEDYAPTWYRAEHHNALKCTIEKMNRMGM